jgi:tRNA (adenine22-N1)-methyltransferase
MEVYYNNRLFVTGGGYAVKLTPRLQAVADFVPRGSYVADIGTDHAYIPIYLVMTKRARRVLATDIKPGPVAAARQTLELFNLSKSVALRLGKGLAPLEAADEIDTIIIAGMGGETICSILADGPPDLLTKARLILQPMTDTSAVRRWLANENYRIIDENLAREGRKIYEVIVAEPGRQEELAWLEFGPVLTANRHRLLAPLLRSRLNRLVKALDLAKGAKGERGLGRIGEINEQIGRLEEVLAWLKQPK